MAYTLTYRMAYQDRHVETPADWEIRFYLKDGPAVNVQSLECGVPACAINTSNPDRDPFASILGSKAVINYVYDGNGPIPDIFINIQEDTWLVEVLKNGVVQMKGFIRPDGNGYPLKHPPYVYQINVTDGFQVMKGKNINLLDDAGLFLYSEISWGEFFNRTLFSALGYDDPILKLHFTRRPEALAAGKTIAEGLFLHTDLFYDFEKGPKSVYDCLQIFLESTGCRMFFSEGAYWIQRIADMDQIAFSVLKITPTNLSGEVTMEVNVTRRLGTSLPANDMYYLSASAPQVVISPALQKQEFSYKLQAINQAKNFDWKLFTGTSFEDWIGPNPGSGLTLNRVGSGSVEDPYRARFTGSGDTSLGAFISQHFLVDPYQIIGIDLKALAYFTTGVRLNVFLQPVGVGKLYYLSGASWVETDGNPRDDQIIIVSPSRTTRMGSMSIITDYIPGGAPDGYTLFLNINGPEPANDPDDPLPPGDFIRNDIWPVFLRIYSNNYLQIDTKIENSGNYSYVGDDMEPLIMDTNDRFLSNTIFYDSGTGVKPIPSRVGTWKSIKNPALGNQTINEAMSRSRLDSAKSPVYGLDLSAYSNRFALHHAVNCPDTGKRYMALSDQYDTAACQHRLVLQEIFPEGSGNGTYTITPIERKKNG